MQSIPIPNCRAASFTKATGEDCLFLLFRLIDLTQTDSTLESLETPRCKQSCVISFEGYPVLCAARSAI